MSQGALQPLVSIIIPAYNGGDFLAQAIDSALAQTYPNIEVLVVNDGSDDQGHTERVAQSYGERIRYFDKPNGGVSSALNHAICEMRGEYFSWLSHDDLYTNDKIARQMTRLVTLPPKSAVYGDFYLFDQASGSERLVSMPGVGPEAFRYWITVKNMLNGCTLLIPKAAFGEVGLFDESLRTTQDYDLWFRMAEHYGFYHLAGAVVRSRQHQGQCSIRLAHLAQAECDALLTRFTTQLTAQELTAATGRAPAEAYARIAGSMFRRRFTQAGRTALRHSFKGSPSRGIYANACTLAATFQCYAAAAKGIAMHYAVTAIRPFLPPGMRRMLRNLVLGKPRTDPHPDTVLGLDLKEKFSKVYDENIFQGEESRSGEGSTMVQTAIIRREIPKLVQELGVTSFLDAPCGDWNWMRKVDLPVERYIGVDIVEQLIARNQKQYGSEKVSFQTKNIATDTLPKADLIFSRDCLVHLSFDDALAVIANFKRSGATYLLTTTFTARDHNVDLGTGFWRPLNKQIAPFNFPEPLRLINEGCTEADNQFTDKSLGLWRLADIQI